MDKKIYMLLGALVIIFGLLALPNLTENPLLGTGASATLQGRYVGYAWRGEAEGAALDEANQYIETILELDGSGEITAAKMRFYVQKDGYWIPRQSGNSFVEVDFTVDPAPADPGENYSPGTSMFTIYNADMMSFYAVAVDDDGTSAAALVCPVTRYQYEIKLPPGFDYSTPFGDLTIKSGELVPTVRVSGSGILRPGSWEEIEDRVFLDMERYSYVVTRRGIFEGFDQSTPVRSFYEAMGVEFAGNNPRPQGAVYGYFGLGGWAGNYRGIEEYLVGKNAKDLTSLVDWSVESYAGGINEKNQFGVDVESGATRTVQNGVDTIAGATVRMSRESTSYQRALVSAGIITEQQVIVGRF